VAIGVLSSVAAVGQEAAVSDDVEQKVEALLAQMTTQEKLGQMSQTDTRGKDWEQIKDQLRNGRWGSFLNSGTPEEKAELQRVATQESRLGIPLIFGRDVIHGYQTIFPIPLGEAASWNPELVRQAARIAAREASAEGVHWTFAPMMDIARDPRWGRIAESLGEDPHLASVMAAAMVRGYQGDSLSAADSIAACAKHYVGYGAAEGGRDYNTTWIPENLLRDVYLAPFQAAREAGIATYMTAFNALNGVPASGNSFLLRQVLRDEWGFDGFVVSDYTAVIEMIPHGYAADEKDAALKGIRGGVDLEMVSTSFYDNAQALMDGGQLDLELVDEAVRNILRIKFRLGLFDDKGQATPAAAEPPSSEVLDVAKRLAAESLVLLKNDGDILPLSKSVGKVAVIGPLADSPRDQLGTWVLSRGGDTITPLAAFRQMLGEERIAYARGLVNSRDTSHDGFPEAVEAASEADVALLFLGEEASLSGEAASRAFLDLPGAQEALVAEIAETGKPTVAVIMAGRPLTFSDVAEKTDAVVWAWHPGTMGGPAIAETIMGTRRPREGCRLRSPEPWDKCLSTTTT